MNYRKSLNFQEKYYNVLSLVPISNFFLKKKKLPKNLIHHNSSFIFFFKLTNFGSEFLDD